MVDYKEMHGILGILLLSFRGQSNKNYFYICLGDFRNVNDREREELQLQFETYLLFKFIV